MNNDKNNAAQNNLSTTKATDGVPSALNDMDALSQYLKTTAGVREGRAIPPLEKWNPQNVADMDLVIKANGEWWHEGSKVTRESLVSLFASILWKEESEGVTEYFLKTPVQKIRIQVEDAPLFITDVGIINENDSNWLEFTTTTGDVVRLDDKHSITLKTYNSDDNDAINVAVSSASTDANTENPHQLASDASVRPYMMVRNGLTALINRNTFYHLIDIGELSEKDGNTILTLNSGGNDYQLSMPTN
ncbi:DUF1285 domain-containing protein [Psychrobacter sp. B38]|uniref:DUF1285 domain-containing protein n=1 Tax=Psychrobacter sp. B38 TaxID=3143538 RepID=UPI00320ED0A8